MRTWEYSPEPLSAAYRKKFKSYLELKEASGVPMSTAQRILKQGAEPSITTLLKLCSILDVSPTRCIRRTEEALGGCQ